MSHTESNKPTTQIGVISDTHGLLRPEAIAALQNSDLILHAGDIGTPAVLQDLETIAPVIAVRGNNDRGAWAEAIPERQTLEIAEVPIHLIHILRESTDSELTGMRVVVSGHSHKPLIEERSGILFLNPGSAGPRRFKLPIAVARLWIERGSVQAQIIELAG